MSNVVHLIAKSHRFCGMKEADIVRVLADELAQLKPDALIDRRLANAQSIMGASENPMTDDDMIVNKALAYGLIGEDEMLAITLIDQEKPVREPLVA